MKRTIVQGGKIFLSGILFAAGIGFFSGLAVVIAQSLTQFQAGELISSSAINANFTIAAPQGFIGAFFLSACPTGWVPADGTNGTPDLRGQFLRGLNDFSSTAGTRSDGRQDPDGAGRTLGHYQSDQVVSHSHTENVGAVGGTPNCIEAHTCGVTITTPLVTEPYGGNETRPRNTALIFCMRRDS